MAININILLAAIRRRLGMPYWSFSAWAKLQVKQAVNFIGEFQRVVAEEARRNDVYGVICAHIHHAVIEDIDGIHYVNTGDWVESCTAIAEHPDGRLELISWGHRIGASASTIAPLALPRPVALGAATAKEKDAQAA
jgi:UDP-2,3-diacylglucosamine pyrophosphatase LpxH